MASRWVLLIVGPCLLIGSCYCMTVGRGKSPTEAQSAHADQKPGDGDFNLKKLQAGAESGLSQPQDSNPDKTSLIDVACDKRARELGKHIEQNHRVIVRPPFVLAGNLSEQSLDQHYRNTILPTAQALELAYFDFAPNEPITILLYSTEDEYAAAARKLDRRNTVNYYGYYIRPDRRIVLNVQTGAGTLAHELTHALAHFDFPNMPEWFDEGLAAVYEEADFSDDGLQLIGVSNWRLNHLLHAMQKGQLRSLEALITTRRIRAERQSIDYAHARYFCLYLQERGLLPFFYRKFKANAASDPSGLKTLTKLFGKSNLDSVDRDFRQWVIKHYKQVRGLAALYKLQATELR
jgi:hypothetical protein